MKKSKFVKSTFILLIGGFLTKLLGMIIKIVMTRLLGTEGIGIYMLIMPTFSLFIGLSQLGMPIAISKLVSEGKWNNKNLVACAIPLSLFVNVLIIVFLLFSGHFLAVDLLHDARCYYGLISIGLVLPFISISNILRGYFFGKERMIPHVISNFVEDIIRLITLSIGIPIFLIHGIEYAIAFVVLSNIISELTSIFILFFFLPKHFSLSKDDLKPNLHHTKEIMRISIPTTIGRLIGNIGYFFEPIILTYVLLKIGYSNDFIVREYGIFNGYIMPLVTLPSFFTMAISQALLPVISNSYANDKRSYTKSKIHQAILFCMLIGIPVTILFLLFPSFPLEFIYHTTEGIPYLLVMAPVCLLHYIQGPLTSSLQGMGFAKTAMQGTLVGMLLRTSVLFGVSFCHIGMWGLVCASSINIIYVTVHHIYYVHKYLKGY